MKIASEKQSLTRPFLKWAGGKQQIVKHLLKCLPYYLKDRTYREPFLGGASLFFALKPNNAILSDANEHLIDCYKSVRDQTDLIAEYLQEHRRNNSEKYYYKIRQFYNKANHSAAQAARFIYLNRAGYNGVFRVNQQGLYNVPYGKRKRLALPTLMKLQNIAKLLLPAKLKACSFGEAVKSAGPRDFVYLDPPYPPINGTSYFTHYTKDRFGHDDQVKVAELARVLDRKGAKFMLSNADTPKIRELYEGFIIVSLPVTRFITCKKIRHCVKELIIINYRKAIE